MIHDLKILPEYFVEVVRGNKTFEVRKDDRPFNVGDELILYEVNCGRYTGRNIKVIITYILRNPDYCKEGYCILGFKQPVKHGRWIWDSNAPHREHGAYKCSNCGCHSDFEENYCYNCGAKMDIIYEDDKVRAIKVTGWDNYYGECDAKMDGDVK